MNRQFLFRMQNQETEHKRPSQPDFKIRSTALLENQRLMNNNSFQSSTMYQRPQQVQINEYESENMTSLHAKLHQEADKIRKWKVQTELDIKEKDKKLSSASTQIETMKKSLLELQLDNERLSSRMQEEIDDRQEVMQKVSSTREMCNILKSAATTLEDRMLRCETEKTELKYAGRETSQYLEDLTNKFETLRISAESNHQKLLLKYETEMKESQEKEKSLHSKCQEATVMIKTLEADINERIKKVSDLQAGLLEKNSTLDRLEKSLSQLEEKNSMLEKDLKVKEEDFKESAIRVLTIQDEKRELEEKLEKTEAELCSLQDTKDKMYQEMTDSCAKYEKDLLHSQDNLIKLEKELQTEQSKMKNCQTELEDALTSVEKLKSSRDILMLERTELEMKMDLQSFELTNLRAEKDERKEEIHRVNEEMDMLLKKLDKENLCKLQYQEIEKDLEAKIFTLKMEKEEQSQTMLQLEEKLERKKIEVSDILSKESELTQNLQSEIRVKEKELDKERSTVVSLKVNLDETKDEVTRMDSELTSKSEEIGELRVQIEEQKSLAEKHQRELKQKNDDFETFKKMYEEERRKTDELNSQLTDINIENKEHGKSLTSQQKKLAAQTKHNKELEKEIKSVKADLNMEIKKNIEKDKVLKSMKKEIEELTHTKDNLTKSTMESEEELKNLREKCKEDKKISEEAMLKAIEMQEKAKKEMNNAKALTDCQLAEMMGTLDSYKQSSEKILADKDAEIRSLKNKLEASDDKNMFEKDALKDENNKLSSDIKILCTDKENLRKELREAAIDNQSLKKKFEDLEKQMELQNNVNKSLSVRHDSPTSQLTQHMLPVAPVTPQKQQAVPWTPKTPKTPVQTKDNQNLILRTPQRSILRASSSVPKRRKVAFLADNNDDDQDLPSSSDDLMELEVETENAAKSTIYQSTPISISRTPKVAAMNESVHRMTPKRTLTPLNKPLMTSTPRKKTSETPDAGTFTSVSDKSKDNESKLQKQESNPRTPNIRNVPAKKPTHKFFTTSPKDKAINRTRIKEKAKKEKDGQFSWFDLDSVYGFNPED